MVSLITSTEKAAHTIVNACETSNLNVFETFIEFCSPARMQSILKEIERQGKKELIRSSVETLQSSESFLYGRMPPLINQQIISNFLS